MIDLREILIKAFTDAVGQMPDYKIRLNSIGYYEKGILLESDIIQLDNLIENKNQILQDKIIYPDNQIEIIENMNAIMIENEEQ